MTRMMMWKRSKLWNVLLTICVTSLLLFSISDYVIIRRQQDKTPYDDISNFPKYHFGFFFPLEVDLRKLVDAKIVNKTEIEYSPINRHPFKYLHRPPDCVFTSKISDVSYLRQSLNNRLLILVKSAVGNDRLRMTIRMTWAKDVSRFKTRIVFLLAVSANSSNKFVNLEADYFNDIVQEDFLDNYSNNTYKTIMGYNWAVKYCSTADFFLFVDDDHFVNIPKVMNYTQNIPPSQRENLIVGRKVEGGTPSRSDTKWVLSKDEFPFHKFPPYLGGGAYLTSYTCARRFMMAFPYVEFFWIDDVYIGIIANKLNVELHHAEEFKTHEVDISLDRGFFSHFNNHNTDDIAEAWYQIT